MREIKFRIWHPVGKFFSYWGFVERGMFTGIPSSNEDGFTLEYVKENSQQFTGLRDKNGKKIYESDLLIHDGHGEITTVVFSDGMFLAKRKHGEDELAFIVPESVLVIGNICENPELL